jgi:hypothetical protein
LFIRHRRSTALGRYSLLAEKLAEYGVDVAWFCYSRHLEITPVLPDLPIGTP